jgi:hypothetical protein
MNYECEYLIGKIQEQLAIDPRTSKQDVKLRCLENRIHISGQTATEERKQTIASVVAEFAPDFEICNELTIIETSAPRAPEVIND